MIVHEAIDMDDCLISNDGCLQIDKKTLSVPIVPEYVFPLGASGGHVIECTGIFYSEGSRHWHSL